MKVVPRLYALYICKGRFFINRQATDCYEEVIMSRQLDKTYNPKEIEPKLGVRISISTQRQTGAESRLRR